MHRPFALRHLIAIWKLKLTLSGAFNVSICLQDTGTPPQRLPTLHTTAEICIYYEKKRRLPDVHKIWVLRTTAATECGIGQIFRLHRGWKSQKLEDMKLKRYDISVTSLRDLTRYWLGWFCVYILASKGIKYQKDNARDLWRRSGGSVGT